MAVHNTGPVRVSSRSPSSRRLLRRLPRLADRFPAVAKLTLRWVMVDGHRALEHKTWVFNPDVRFMLQVDCANRGCVDGGHDLEALVASAVAAGQSEMDGELRCKGWRAGTDARRLDPCDCELHFHVDIEYQQ